uniref:Uncharacterized protein n=1 Tax=Ackermannviridae sp. TaxID=2831612 RepID=A0A8S5RU97_9CAUD|nr:MAG TPA: hypothetical protein [Ackermannviridae sp.]
MLHGVQVISKLIFNVLPRYILKLVTNLHAFASCVHQRLAAICSLYRLVCLFKDVWLARILFTVHTSDNPVTGSSVHNAFQRKNIKFFLRLVRFNDNRFFPEIHRHHILLAFRLFLFFLGFFLFLATVSGNRVLHVDCANDSADRNIRHRSSSFLSDINVGNI